MAERLSMIIHDLDLLRDLNEMSLRA